MAKLFNFKRKTPEQETVTAARQGPVQIQSPFAPTPTHLNQVVWADLSGIDAVPLTRAEAMTLPSVVRGVNLIKGTIGRLPLVAYGPDEKPLDTQPVWCGSTAQALPAFHRLLWTVDDLIFYGFSLWVIGRNGRNQIVTADRVLYDRWCINSDNKIEVDGDEVSERDYILFYGSNEGLIQTGQKAVRQYADLMATASRAAKTPMAYLELHDIGETPMTDDEIDTLVDRWVLARRGDNGGVAYTNSSIEIKEHGAAQEHLLIAGRNASAVDVARLLGIPAALIDAVAQQGNLTYETTQDRIAEFIDFGIAPILAAISGRLSQDDVTPSGVTIGFDLDKFLGEQTPLSAKTADERIADKAPAGSGVTPSPAQSVPTSKE